MIVRSLYRVVGGVAYHQLKYKASEVRGDRQFIFGPRAVCSALRCCLFSRGVHHYTGLTNV